VLKLTLQESDMKKWTGLTASEVVPLEGSFELSNYILGFLRAGRI
jgi:hypothetical protein